MFIKFNSRIHSREGVPTLSGLLQEAEDIDRALRDDASFRELCATVTHTEKDTLDLVDPAVVARVSEFVADLVRCLPAIGGTDG